MKNYWSAIWLGVLWGIATTLAPLPSAAQGSASAPAATAVSSTFSIDHVEVSRAGQRTQVRVQNASGLAYHVSRLTDPNRLVMDFDGVRLAPGRNTATSSNDPVSAIRLGQFSPQQVRLVIDLAHPSGYAVEKDGQDLVVTFADAIPPDGRGTQSFDKSAKTSGAAAQAGAGPADHSAHSAEFALPLSVFNQTPLAALAPDLATPATAPAPAQPESQPAARAAAAAAQVQATAQDSLAQAAAQATAAQGPSNQTEDQAPHYSGEPVSVNLKDVDLKDFFRLIHEISSLNVVLDPSVHGTVTLVLDDVPWDQALDIVLRNNGLAKQLDGNVLRIASQDTLRREAEQRLALKKAESDAVEPVTVTRVLSYAKASELVTPLRRFLSPRGDIISQDRANMLIIRDIPSTMPQMDSLIRQLDRKTAQVEIQARVVQASRSFARDIGTEFGLAASTNQGRNVFGGITSAAGASPTPSSVASGTNPMPLVTNFPANAPTTGLSFGYTGNGLSLDYIITAAESKGVGKLLSSPQLVTQNNAQAIVKQGTEVPIQTTINNTISVQYVDAVLKLQVTPQITVDGTVYMDVLVENTQIDNGIPLVQGIPALDTESAQTKVIVADGGTVVIGGIMVNQQQTNVYEVPLVGSIPLIGHLFKRNTVSVESQELLFFLTPRILPT